MQEMLLGILCMQEKHPCHRRRKTKGLRFPFYMISLLYKHKVPRKRKTIMTD